MARLGREAFVGLAVALSGGCMLTPTDDGLVTRTDAPLSFSGYHTERDSPVQVKAWDYGSHAMVPVGMPVRSASAAAPASYFDEPIYAWSAPRTLGPSFWRAGPRGGQCAVVAADTVSGGRTVSMMTVDPEWSECYADHRTKSSFYTNCRSDNNPRAALYTSDFRPVELTPDALRTAGTLATFGVRITLDNFTPNAFEFCNAAHPEGCPEVPSPDPNTYKFFLPDGASVVAEGSTLAFSIAPSRKEPMTVYLDDLRSSRIDFRLAGERLVMGIDFEQAGPEIRMNCIDNIVCAFVDGKTIELGSPRAELSFALAVEGGQIGFDDVSVTFSATGGDEATQAAASIGVAMQEHLRDNGEVRRAVGAALDTLLRRVGPLPAVYPVRRIARVGANLHLHAGCPTD